MKTERIIRDAIDDLRQWRRALEGAVCDLEATFAMFPDPQGDAHPR
jgi:hypothetical protein